MQATKKEGSNAKEWLKDFQQNIGAWLQYIVQNPFDKIKHVVMEDLLTKLAGDKSKKVEGNECRALPAPENEDEAGLINTEPFAQVAEGWTPPIWKEWKCANSDCEGQQFDSDTKLYEHITVVHGERFLPTGSLDKPTNTKSSITNGKCPGEHDLESFVTPNDTWFCSECKTCLGQGQPMRGCRICDYDVCDPKCKQEPKKQQKKRKQNENTAEDIVSPSKKKK